MSSWATIRDTLRSLTKQFTEQDPELTAVRIRLWRTEPLLYAPRIAETRTSGDLARRVESVTAAKLLTVTGLTCHASMEGVIHGRQP
jgi:hypothetical protein